MPEIVPAKEIEDPMQLLYRKVRYILFLVVLSGALLNGCRQPLAPADKWRAKILEAHGGAAALEQVSTIVFSGTIATREDKGTVVLILSRPQKLRATMSYSNRHEDRILLGSRGWRNSGAGFEEAAGYSLDALIFQYNHLYLPMGLLGGNYGISYAEKKIDGKIFPVLQLTGANGPPMEWL